MLIPYMSFNGNCEEALHLYAEAFGGKIEYVSRWSEQTGNSALAGKVMHAHVSLGEFGVLNAGDTETPVVFGNAISMLARFDDATKAKAAAAKLYEGGALVQDFTANPPPDEGSMCAVISDKFGYTWIFACPNV